MRDLQPPKCSSNAICQRRPCCRRSEALSLGGASTHMLRTMQHHTASGYFNHNSIVAARRTPWLLVRQCRQHSCDIGQVTLYPISGGWVLRELTTGDGRDENAFANHVASVRGSPTCEACPRMEFLQESSIRKNFVSFVPTASNGGTTAGHDPGTCS